MCVRVCELSNICVHVKSQLAIGYYKSVENCKRSNS